MVNVAIVLSSILLAVAGQLLMKKGMLAFGTFPITQIVQNIIPMLTNPFVFGGFALFGFSSILWLAALSRLNLSFVYPMVSIAYVLVTFASIVLFKENVSAIRWTGVAVICFGVFLISRS